VKRRTTVLIDYDVIDDLDEEDDDPESDDSEDWNDDDYLEVIHDDIRSR
jgi:hypothetical protein